MNRTGPLVGVMSVMTVVIILVLAAAALATMLWGSRQRARRRAADTELAERSEAAGLAPPETVESTTPVAPPVAPGPPPLAGMDEPIPAADVQSNPAAAAAQMAPPADAPEDSDLTRLKGLGPKVAARLNSLGIQNLDQLARLSSDEAEALDAEMGPFQGRIARDRWIEQARLLAAGDTAGFEAQFGKL